MTRADDVRLLAFYLPQFHPIPENSQWWGPGFTEWTSVTRARPLFPGHAQPRLPRDLGFYDLRLPEARAAQAQLAREHGVHGFCYYTYWLKDGKRLLEAPMEAMLRDGAPDFPFCVCWANESWTRRWDGGEDDVLAAQSHDDANNAAFFEAMVPYFRDARYIRVHGRPLLLIYRATLLPDAAATVRQWRDLARKHGLPAPYLVAVEFFDINGETMVARGFDAVCEFPPIMAGADQSSLEVSTRTYGPDFQARLLDYERLAASFEARPAPSYRRFRGVTLGWDNTARRGAKATVCVNFSVLRYRRWLARAITAAEREAPAGERLVFVNAWNEWAEGTYLEPDQQNGLAYLEGTRAALEDPAAVLRGAAPAAGAADAALAPPAGPAAAPPAPRASGEPARATPAARASALRVVGITCVGNEADLVEAFVRHHAALLDQLVILEHNTQDGTRDILAALAAEGLPITVAHSSEPTFDQLRWTNALLRDALAGESPDWVFPLDCDEFLLADSRAQLDAALAAASATHGRIPWVTYAPSPGDDPAEAHPLRRIRHCYDLPPPSIEAKPWVWKLAINVRFLGDYHLDRYEISRGGHFLAVQGDASAAQVPMPPLAGVRLAHFPVRSAEQMTIKIGLGLLARIGTGEPSPQYARLWKAITSGVLDAPLLAETARTFLEAGFDPGVVTQDTPMRYAPLPAPPLAYGNLGLPAAALILKWVERNLLDDAARRDVIFNPPPPVQGGFN
jgi:hypothetical protein